MILLQTRCHFGFQVSEIMAAEFIPTPRGGRFLVLENFEYTVNRKSDTHTFWRCINKKTCPATVVTVKDTTDISKRDKAIHNHETHAAKINSDRKIANLKEQVKERIHQPVKRLYSEAFQDEDNLELVSATPSFAAVKSRLYNERRKLLPPLPTSRASITLEGSWTQTVNGNPFLLANDGVDEKILVFTTDENLTQLSQSQEVFVDGTFAVAPSLFAQMYTMHIRFLGQMIPVVFALLPDKRRDTYNRLFDIVSRLCQERNLQFSPQCIQTDFEMAAMQAVRTSFMGAQTRGCFFHYCQSLWRKVSLSIYLPIHLSIHLSIYLSIYPSIYLSLSIYLSIYLYIYIYSATKETQTVVR